MFNFNFDKVCITSHSIYLRRFRPKTVFVLTTKPRWKLLSSAVYHQGIYQPYNVFIFGFLWDNWISQNFLRLHIIYLRCSQTKIDFCIFIQSDVETIVVRSIIKAYIKPHNVFIFEFLCRNQISQKSFRLHSIYLCSKCVFIKKSKIRASNLKFLIFSSIMFCGMKIFSYLCTVKTFNCKRYGLYQRSKLNGERDGGLLDVHERRHVWIDG